MKVLVYPADEHGCGHHRLIYPVGVLREQDPDLDVLIVPPKDRQLSLVVKGTEVIDVRLPDGVDVVVFQRPTDWRLASAIRLLRSKRVTVVVDVDDDLAAIHPANPAWTFLDPNRAKHEMDPLRGRIRPEVIADMEAKKTSEYSHSWHHLADACKHASLVTVSTPGLLRRYAAHGRGHVLDNYVADGYLAVPHVDSDLLGWPAALHSHPNDPAVLGPALHRLVGEGARFVTWGQDYPADVLSRRAADAFGLREPVELRTDVGIFEWPGSIAELGVGIAPLADTRFNQSKCLDEGMRITTDRGVVRAGDIQPGMRVWHDRWHTVEAVEHSAPVDGVEIGTSFGYRLRLTRTHRMLVNGVWTQAGSIAIGDRMEMEPESAPEVDLMKIAWPADSRMSRPNLNVDHYAFIAAPEGPRITLTPRWARMLGAFVGDGSVGQATLLQISCDGQDQDWIDLLTSDFLSMGFTPHTEQIRTFGGEIIRKRGVRVSSAHLLRVLESIGLVAPRPNGRPIRVPCVPEVIWMSPKEVIAEFIASYFEADGHCTETGVEAVSKTENLLRDIQRLLLLFGIKSRILPRVHRIAKVDFEGTYWHLILGRDAADVFVKTIGFRSSRKSSRLDVVTNRPHSNALKRMVWSDEVTSIRPITITPVDIQVEGSVFVAAGFVSHNSRLKVLELSAVGVPWVASPRTEYAKFHRLGAGLLADKPRAWYSSIKRLLDSPALREEMSLAGREVARQCALSSNAWRFWEAWQRAYHLDREKSTIG